MPLHPNLSARLSALLLLGLGMVLGFGLSLGRDVHAERSTTAPTVSIPETQSDRKTIPWQDMSRLAEVLARVRSDYVEDVSDHELIDAAIRGMVSDLDPYSALLEPTEYADMRIATSGAYSGVGLEIAVKQEAVTVVSSIEDSPAAQAGIREGDVVLAIDGAPLDSKDLDSAIDRLRGKAGSAVKLTVQRPSNAQPQTFTLKRANVQMRSVKHQLLEPGYGYIRITQFSDTTVADLTRAITELDKSNHGALQGLVLDLRNNPGGVLEAAVGVSDAFLQRGVIVSANGRASDARFEMDAHEGDLLAGAPIAVLVNGGSASASEIVAGALKDHDRATLVGQKTFGKGSVQTILPLSDGRAIKLTTSHYYTPSGASIHGRGIVPDVVVDEGDEATAAKTLARPVDVKNDRELEVGLATLKQARPIRQSLAR